jgi:hypothetical protein
MVFYLPYNIYKAIIDGLYIYENVILSLYNEITDFFEEKNVALLIK